MNDLQIEYHTWESPNLKHGFELKVYGTRGKPMLVFPTSNGRFYQYEDFGMIEAIRPFIEAQKVVVFTVDGIDWQTWWNNNAYPSDKALRAVDYENCIVKEVIPFIYRHINSDSEQKLIATGCSFGAYHAANTFFKHPDLIDTIILLSGVYSIREFVGEFFDDNIYFNDPLTYLQNLSEKWYLEKFRQSNIIICAGNGNWEDRFREGSSKLSNILKRMNVKHWFDIWGHDVNHDWPWWRKQLPYFLNSLNL